MEIKIKDTALVVGANGVIGKKLIDFLLEEGTWDVVGLSRKGGKDRDRLKNLAVDLLDRHDVQEKLQDCGSVNHIFYAAYQDRPSWEALVKPNMEMLVNLMNTIEPVALNLQHVSLMQGYKVYGAHLGPFKTPAKEDDAGIMPPEFNWSQQQFLQERQQGKNWSWSAIRPSVVGGTSLGNPMNLVLLIAVYASISKELKLPLRFPGKPGAYHTLMEMTDAGLLAKATVWAASNPAGANQAFNIANGDLFRWRDLWPKIADYFDMPSGTPLYLPLQDVMKDKVSLWESIQRKYDLCQYKYENLSNWAFGDFVFSWNYDFFADSTKARRFGFHDYVDTEQMFFKLFDEFKKQGVIPTYG
ncbi:SDR family oxidoreductase [Olivibacter sp. CPCC 100613]|uniref:SDR family oxidoreductase n=1 Tax=Olivibacter sp. CPCC 100613 TaxID=3079931 RepID=UPI002FF5177B